MLNKILKEPMCQVVVGLIPTKFALLAHLKYKQPNQTARAELSKKRERAPLPLG